MKEKFKTIKKKISDKENIGIVIIGIMILIFLIFTAIYIFGTKNISSIEEKTIKEKSNDVMMYLENITLPESNDIDRYIMYALDYSYNNNSKDIMTCEEIYNFISSNFTIKISVDDIRNMGVSPIMLEKNITYDNTKDAYKINETIKDANTIAKTKIHYYKLDKISKMSKKKYVVTYSKYVINDPYEMLNYYMDSNINSDGKEDGNGNYTYELVDTAPIINYLTGSGNLGEVKKLIKDENVNNYATLDEKGKIKVTYVVVNNQLLIDKIK